MTRYESESQSVAVPSRPHYVPEEVWLGVQIGEWPIEAFTDEKQAAHWASEGAYPNKRRVWKVTIPDDVTVYAGEVVPKTHVLRAVAS